MRLPIYPSPEINNFWYKGYRVITLLNYFSDVYLSDNKIRMKFGTFEDEKSRFIHSFDVSYSDLSLSKASYNFCAWIYQIYS